MSKQELIMVYTDGACSNNPGGPGGWAATLNYKECYEVISGNEVSSTNNRMELTAVVKAIEHLIHNKRKKIIINSDSAYVINAINKEWLFGWESKGWKTKKGDELANLDLWKQLLSFLKKKDMLILFNKVKGHDGNTFNELADKAAKKEVEKVKDKLRQQL